MTKYKKGEIVKCCISGIEKYGAFVTLDEYFNGLIHISEISEGFVSNINNFVNIGDTIYAKVLEVDENNFQVKLSIKNINYKNNKHISKITESKNGFKTLEEKLPIWVDEKMNEIKNKQNM